MTGKWQEMKENWQEITVFNGKWREMTARNWCQMTGNWQEMTQNDWEVIKVIKLEGREKWNIGGARKLGARKLKARK